MSERPCAVALVAPSGTGKTTVARALLAQSSDYRFSVSATTRTRRGAERDGVDYHFVTRERFEALVEAGHFGEWAEVHGRLYGTPLSNFDAARERGQTLILDIDFQGALQIMRAVPDALSVFLLPPDGETLLGRLEKRGTETPAEVDLRLRTALEELAQAPQFPIWLVNDEISESVRQIRQMVEWGARPLPTSKDRRLVAEIAEVLETRLAAGEGPDA